MDRIPHAKVEGPGPDFKDLRTTVAALLSL